MSESNDNQQEQDGRADFDFFIGAWKVHNRNLPERLKGSTRWETFEGTTVARKMLGGMRNFEEYTMERASGLRHGITARFFNPRSREWSISLSDAVNGLDPHPAIGVFKDGRGEFYSQEPWEGKSIFCRVIWSEITPTSCHWEQAFSVDGGKTWETNWITDFERIS